MSSARKSIFSFIADALEVFDGHLKQEIDRVTNHDRQQAESGGFGDRVQVQVVRHKGNDEHGSDEIGQSKSTGKKDSRKNRRKAKE